MDLSRWIIQSDDDGMMVGHLDCKGGVELPSSYHEKRSVTLADMLLIVGSHVCGPAGAWDLAYWNPQ